MARTGGRFPFDKLNALTGPVRVVWALPSVAAPADLSDIVAQVADAEGEYPTQTGWNDFGLMTDSPSLSHDRDTSGIEYEGVGQLFEKVSNVTRSFTHHVGEIDEENLQIIENTTITEAVAASAAAAPSPHAAQTKVHVGLYNSFPRYRIALIAYRPDGAGLVTEPAPSNRTRPPAVGRVFSATLSGDIGDVDFSAGDPVGIDITFNIDPDQTFGAGKEHGYWVIEQPGAILA
jgi:hypothetical protein